MDEELLKAYIAKSGAQPKDLGGFLKAAANDRALVQEFMAKYPVDGFDTETFLNDLYKVKKKDSSTDSETAGELTEVTEESVSTSESSTPTEPTTPPTEQDALADLLATGAPASTNQPMTTLPEGAQVFEGEPTVQPTETPLQDVEQEVEREFIAENVAPVTQRKEEITQFLTDQEKRAIDAGMSVEDYRSTIEKNAAKWAFGEDSPMLEEFGKLRSKQDAVSERDEALEYFKGKGYQGEDLDRLMKPYEDALIKTSDEYDIYVLDRNKKINSKIKELREGLVYTKDETSRAEIEEQIADLEAQKGQFWADEEALNAQVTKIRQLYPELVEKNPEQAVLNHFHALVEEADQLGEKLHTELDPETSNAVDRAVFAVGDVSKEILRKLSPAHQGYTTRLAEIQNELETLAPIVLIDRYSPKEENRWSQMRKAFVQGITGGGEGFSGITEQQRLESLHDTFSSLGIEPSKVDEATQEALAHDARMTSGEEWGQMLGFTAGMMTDFFLTGAAAAKGAKAASKFDDFVTLSEKISKQKNSSKLTKYLYGGIETGAQYEATGWIGSTETEQSEGDFLAGFLGYGLSAPVAKGLDAIGSKRLLMKIFGKANAPKAYRLFEEIGRSVSAGVAEVPEEYGNEIAQLWNESTTYKEFTKLLEERFGKLDDNLKFGAQVFTMGLGFGAASSMGRYSSIKYDEWIKQQPEDVQQFFKEEAQKVENDLQEASVESKPEQDESTEGIKTEGDQVVSVETEDVADVEGVRRDEPAETEQVPQQEEQQKEVKDDSEDRERLPSEVEGREEEVVEDVTEQERGDEEVETDRVLRQEQEEVDKKLKGVYDRVFYKVREDKKSPLYKMRDVIPGEFGENAPFKSQGEITKLIEESNLPKNIKEDYTKALQESEQLQAEAPKIRDQEWEAKAKEGLPPSNIESPKQLESKMKDKPWGMLTAENPERSQLTDEENAQRNEEAKKWLEEKGYNPQPIFGKYENAENSFFVEDLLKEDAIEFAKKFNQESVATNEGLVYQDGSMNPIKGMNFGVEQDDYYSTMRTKDGETSSFAVEYDFDTKVEPEVKQEPVKKTEAKKKPVEKPQKKPTPKKKVEPKKPKKIYNNAAIFTGEKGTTKSIAKEVFEDKDYEKISFQNINTETKRVIKENPKRDVVDVATDLNNDMAHPLRVNMLHTLAGQAATEGDINLHNKLMDTYKKMGVKAGQDLAAGKMIRNNPYYVMNALLSDRAEKISEAQAGRLEQDKPLKEAIDQSYKAIIDAIGKEGKIVDAPTKKKLEKIREKRSNIKKDLKSDIKSIMAKANDFTTVLAETAALTPKLIQLAGTYIEEGIVRIPDLANKMQEDLEAIFGTPFTTKDKKTLNKFLEDNVNLEDVITRQLITMYGQSNITQKRKAAKSDAQKIMDAIQNGAFNSEMYTNLVAEKFGIPSITQQDIEFLTELMEVIDGLDAGSLRAKKLIEMNTYINKMRRRAKKTNAQKFASFMMDWMDLFYVHILSGMGTVKRAATAASMTSAIDLMFRAITNPKATIMGIRYFNEFFRKSAILRGDAAAEVYKTGFSPIHFVDTNPENVKQAVRFTDELINEKFGETLSRTDIGKAKKAFRIGLKSFEYMGAMMYRTLIALDVLMRSPMVEWHTFMNEYDRITMGGQPQSTKDFIRKMKQAMGTTELAVAEAQEHYKREVEFLKDKGVKIPKNYKKTRMNELIELKRNQESVEAAKRMADEALLMNDPEGILGKGYRRLASISNFDENASPLSVIPKIMFKTILPIMRVPTNFINRNIDFTPLGFAKAFAGETSTRTGKREYSRAEIRMINAKATAGLMGMTALYFMMFDWDDDEGLKLKEDAPVEITFMGRGAWYKNKDLEPGWKEMSIRFRTPNGRWSRRFSYKDNPAGMMLAPLGFMHDQIKYEKPVSEEDKAEKDKSTIAHLFTQSLISAKAFATSQSYSQGLNDIMGFLGEDDVKFHKSLEKASIRTTRSIMPNIYQQLYKQYKMVEGRPEYEASTFIEKVANNMPIAELLLDDVRTDHFGYPVKRQFTVYLLPDLLVDGISENRDYRKGKKVWELVWKYPEVSLGNMPRGKRSYTEEERYEFQKLYGKHFRELVEDDYAYLDDLNAFELQVELDRWKRKASKYARQDMED